MVRELPEPEDGEPLRAYFVRAYGSEGRSIFRAYFRAEESFKSSAWDPNPPSADVLALVLQVREKLGNGEPIPVSQAAIAEELNQHAADRQVVAKIRVDGIRVDDRIRVPWLDPTGEGGNCWGTVIERVGDTATLALELDGEVVRAPTNTGGTWLAIVHEDDDRIEELARSDDPRLPSIPAEWLHLLSGSDTSPEQEAVGSGVRLDRGEPVALGDDDPQFVAMKPANRDELDQLRDVFGDDAESVQAGLRELYGEVSTSEALEIVLRVMDKTRRGSEMTDEREQRVAAAMDAGADDWNEDADDEEGVAAILTRGIATSLGFFASGTRVRVVGTLSDGQRLVRTGFAQTTFPVSESYLAFDPEAGEPKSRRPRGWFNRWRRE